MSLIYYQSDLLHRILAGTATTAAIVLSQSVAIAKSPQEIAQFANAVTVQVNPSSSDPQMKSGSGFIISKHGNSYTVLTCNHVLKDKPATIRTYDGKSYPITNGQSLSTSNNAIDLALLTFTSSTDYAVAKLGDSDQATVGAQIFVFGYPVNRLDSIVGEARNFEFSPGYVTSRPSGISGGYTMRYSAVTQGGMSGGPVFDVDGRIVGVHGLAESDAARVVNEEGGQVSSLSLGFIVTTKTGFNSAIPINTFLSLKLDNSGSLDVDKAPSTNNSAAWLNAPKSASELYGRGQVSQQQGDDAAAMNDYTQAIRLNPEHAQAYYQRGDIRHEQGDKRGAIEDYSQAIRLAPTYANAYFNRGVIRQNQGDNQGALADFNQYLRLNPDSIFAYYNRGVIRRSLGDARGSFEDFDQVVRLAPDNSRAFYNRAIARSVLGDRKGVIQDFTEALRLDPKYAEVYIDRGLVRRRQGDRQGAIEDFNQALQIQPDNPYTYYNRGLLRRDLGDRQGAVEDLQKSLDLFQQKGDTRSHQKAVEVLERLKNSVVSPSPDPSFDSLDPS